MLFNNLIFKAPGVGLMHGMRPMGGAMLPPGVGRGPVVPIVGQSAGGIAQTAMRARRPKAQIMNTARRQFNPYGFGL